MVHHELVPIDLDAWGTGTGRLLDVQNDNPYLGHVAGRLGYASSRFSFFTESKLRPALAVTMLWEQSPAEPAGQPSVSGSPARSGIQAEPKREKDIDEFLDTGT
jgi:hypothetical protein